MITEIKRYWRADRMQTDDDLSGFAFTGENGAHKFIISGLDAAGAAAAISGTVTGKFLNAQGVTLTLEGTTDNGAATVTLSQACYSVPGRFRFSVYVAAGNQTTCVYSAVGTVTRTDSSAVVDPGTIIPNLQTLIDAAGDCAAAAADAEAAAAGRVRYDAAQTLTDTQKTTARSNIDAVGTLAMTQTGIIAPQWENGRFQASDMAKIPANDRLRSAQPIPVTPGGRLVIWLAPGYTTTIYEIQASGYIGTRNQYETAGESVHQLQSDTAAINVVFSKKTLAAISPNDGADKIHIYATGGALFYALGDVTATAENALTVAGQASAAATAAETAIQKRIFAKSASAYIHDRIIALSDVREDGFYLISAGTTASDGPSGESYAMMGLVVENFSPGRWGTGAFTRQTLFEFSNGKKCYTRASSVNGSYGGWQQAEGGGGGGSITYNNTYNYNSYQNSYAVTATPTITTDTNNFLASTNDTTDRAADIQTMLEETGVCRLGPGDFHISTSITVPDGAMFTGCGGASRLLLVDVPAAEQTFPAIIMKDRSIVSDMRIESAGGTFGTRYATLTERHGILWEGNSPLTGDKLSDYPKRGIISNVRINYFTGGGITLRMTGTNIDNCLSVTNVYIFRCNAGVNVNRLAEFNRFVNVHAHRCYYGAINAGGNNTFVACCFSENNIGMQMGNGTEVFQNNSHGSVIGCIFDHSYAAGAQDSSTRNMGVALEMHGLTAGEIFQGCQIFFGKVQITDSIGVLFDGCNFGNGAAGNEHAIFEVTATTGKQTRLMLANCVFEDTPQISTTGDAVTVTVTDCTKRATGERIGETGIPAGGTTGQILAKASGTDYDAEWIRNTGIPAGGTTGQVLAKASGTDYDVGWVNAGGGSGGVTDVQINGTSIVSSGVANITAAALDAPVTVSGTTPEITCTAGTRYICGEVSTISITPSLSGICDVMFTSGTTAAVLTVPNTVKWPDWFDPTALDADTTYEINIMDGVYGAVMVWA